MAINPRSLMALLLLIVLVSCSARETTNIATRSSPAVSETEDISQGSTPSKEPPTLFPSATPDVTKTVFAQARVATQAAEQSLVAPYPRICTELFHQENFLQMVYGWQSCAIARKMTVSS